MKKLILILLLFPLLSTAQTTINEADIYAAAGNRYEWLLTNINPIDGMGTEQSLIQKMGFVPEDDKSVHKSGYMKLVYTKGIVSGNEKPSYINLHYYIKKHNSKEWEHNDKDIQYKVEIDGDTEDIIKFYINFWTRAINFKDTKPGETVTVRFLTDVAALTVGTNGRSKIVVQTAKDYYKD